jgi:hypothetical protein
MTRFSLMLIAKILAAMLLLIVLRCLAEVFILEYVNPRGLPYTEIRPLVIGAFAASASLTLTLLAIQLGWSRAAIFVATVTVAALFAYQVNVIA